MVHRQAHEVAAGVAATPDAALDLGALEKALEAIENGVRGYEAAAEAAESTDVKNTLTELGEARANTLERLTRVAGDDAHVEPDGGGTVPGAAHRGWIKVKGALAGDEAIVEAAITGEAEAKSDLENSLEMAMPESVADVVRSALDEVTAALQRLESLNS
jgi:uncharacterized protein (TIGR02284 family)